MKQNRGFTIVEISVVIVIISILVTLVALGFTRVQAQARDSSRKVDTLTVMHALASYYNENGEYPSVCTGGDNTGCAISSLSSALTPKYISSIPVDPSGRTSQYVRGTFPGKAYGILIKYEAKAVCKTGADWGGWFSTNAASNGWWGPVATTPVCTDPQPDPG